MKTVFLQRGKGKSTAAIEEAALAQDEGVELVVFVVPEERWINHLYDKMVDVLDMSRIQVWTARQALDLPQLRSPRRLIEHKKGLMRKWWSAEPPYVIIDDADLIHPRLYANLMDQIEDRVRMITGSNIPGVWRHDLTPIDKSGTNKP
jgi:hypothetical protein